jgi:hypothetical protein
MRKVILLTLAAGHLLTGCKSDAEGDKSTPVPEERISYTNEDGTLISNGITLEIKDVKVSRAYLLYDNSTLVPPDNKTSEGRPVKLRLVVEKGWREEDGKVSLGASETIRTGKGQVVLDEKDLFANTLLLYAEAAKTITLTATISRLGRPHQHFVVSFRVWDKNGSGEIKGSYKLFVE